MLTVLGLKNESKIVHFGTHFASILVPFWCHIFESIFDRVQEIKYDVILSPLGASWSAQGAFWDPLGAPKESFGILLELPRGLLEVPRSTQGTFLSSKMIPEGPKWAKFVENEVLREPKWCYEYKNVYFDLINVFFK